MEQTISATLRSGESVVAANVTVRLRITTRNGLAYGEGWFIEPDDVCIDVGSEYDMESTDGRKGRILIRNVNMASGQSTTVQFVCNGRFG